MFFTQKRTIITTAGISTFLAVTISLGAAAAFAFCVYVVLTA